MRPLWSVIMNFGSDFFSILNFVIKIIRLVFECFGDDESQEQVKKSKERSSNGNDDAC